MNTKARIASILKANQLDASITGLPAFLLSDLNLTNNLEFELPTNVRLGHLAEAVVSRSIKSSSNFEVLHENIQIIENKNTIGEIDFIVQELDSKSNIHLELAYKFYLFDPSISNLAIKNWIGPNRNDSLYQKLDKLKQKQFPLLYHSASKAQFSDINLQEVSQALCLLVSLFVPYQFNEKLDPIYENAVKGYYLTFDTFIALSTPEKQYHIPVKKEWGIDPQENENWTDFDGVANYIQTSIAEKQAPLVWEKAGNAFSQFFVVWWEE